MYNSNFPENMNNVSLCNTMVKTGPKKLLKMWQHFTDQEQYIF